MFSYDNIEKMCDISFHNYRCVFGKLNYRVLIRVNSKRKKNMKLEYIVAYENTSDKFDIEHCRIEVKVKVTVGLQRVPHLPQYKLSCPITQL